MDYHPFQCNSAQSDSSSKVIPFPLKRTINETLPSNDARLDWLFRAIDGHENSRKRALIILAANGDVGLLSREEARLLIVDLGLECA